MKWDDAERTLKQAERDGVRTLGGLWAWFRGKPEPPLPDTDAEIDELIGLFEERFPRGKPRRDDAEQ